MVHHMDSTLVCRPYALARQASSSCRAALVAASASAARFRAASSPRPACLAAAFASSRARSAFLQEPNTWDT